MELVLSSFLLLPIQLRRLGGAPSDFGLAMDSGYTVFVAGRITRWRRKKRKMAVWIKSSGSPQPCQIRQKEPVGERG